MPSMDNLFKKLGFEGETRYACELEGVWNTGFIWQDLSVFKMLILDLLNILEGYHSQSIKRQVRPQVSADLYLSSTIQSICVLKCEMQF